MNLILLTLAAIAFILCLTLIDRLGKRFDRARTARQWEERERLLDRRPRVATAGEVRQRRSRRH
ncbi:MAG TPA: hypothetical protein VIA61_00490 [Methylomirabilota bacterium]|jgi:hypothetical protein